MKINRLVEIIVLLLNRDTITAKELAERFEVSTRTIYRDIEVLSMAGVPVYMSKGKGGGISLLEDYSVNKTFLSREDKESLIVALKTLQITKYPEIEYALEKLGTLFQDEHIEDWVQVDFSHWGSNPNESEKFITIKEAILKRQIVNFDYINAFGNKTNRNLEPMKLIYKGHAWYLYGYCKLKNDFRVFRISRIKRLCLSEEKFQRREDNGKNNMEYRDSPKDLVNIKLKFKPEVLHRIYDDFDERHIVKNEDNSSYVTVSFPEDEWLYGYILSFGINVEVLEPQHIREIILSKMKEAIKIYEK